MSHEQGPTQGEGMCSRGKCSFVPCSPQIFYHVPLFPMTFSALFMCSRWKQIPLFQKPLGDPQVSLLKHKEYGFESPKYRFCTSVSNNGPIS